MAKAEAVVKKKVTVILPPDVVRDAQIEVAHENMDKTYMISDFAEEAFRDLIKKKRAERK